MKLPIVVLPGDGIGPEVVSEAIKVMRVVSMKCNHELDISTLPFGGVGIEQDGTAFPELTRTACANTQAILLGAVGDPKYDHLSPADRPEAALLSLRQLIESYANLRPVVSQFGSPLSPFREETLRGVDLLIVRELTGGLYFGEPRGIGSNEKGRYAFNTLRYESFEIERIARVAFEAAEKRRRRLISVDKANVLETSKLWREIVEELSPEYPDVELEHMLVDRAAMEIVAKPRNIDVLLTSNLFGDILSDEASTLAGSMGLLPSASVGGGIGLYEPIHGSAPDIAGKGVANPIGAILSLAMMFRYSFDLEEEAQLVEKGVEGAFADGYITVDLIQADLSKSTEEVGDRIADFIQNY